jgi:hypothetical protein
MTLKVECSECRSRVRAKQGLDRFHVGNGWEALRSMAEPRCPSGRGRLAFAKRFRYIIAGQRQNDKIGTVTALEPSLNIANVGRLTHQHEQRRWRLQSFERDRE